MGTALDKFRGIGVALGLVRAPQKPKEDPRLARARQLVGGLPRAANAGFQDEEIGAGAESQLFFDPESGVLVGVDKVTSGFRAVAPPIDGVDEGFDLGVNMAAQTFTQTDPKNGQMVFRQMGVQVEGAHGLKGFAGASRGNKVVPPEKPVAAKGGKKH